MAETGKIFYISDTHFGHSGIIRYDNRPFMTVEEMDETIIQRWNDVVSDADMVYVLGDFSWYKEEETLKILDRLSGHKVLNPMPFWNGQFRNTIHLYGHVHNSHQWNICEHLRLELRHLQDIPMRMYNVGCMMEWIDYTPSTLAEIEEYVRDLQREEKSNDLS